MFKKIGVRDVTLTNDPKELDRADKILLPGVGAFDNGIRNLNASGIVPTLNKKVLTDKVPVLGICLGMQLLTKGSEEGNEKGLGWIDANTIKFKLEDNLKVPHMGWNYISIQKDSSLMELGKKNKFYFVHSYYVNCNDRQDILATCNYGIEFTCMIQRDNIMGAQFHPEKSHKFGMELFENFSKI